MQLRLDTRRIITALATLTVLLLLAHVGGMISRYFLGHAEILGLIDSFDLNLENNIPTFCTTFVLVFCACLLALVARQETSPSAKRYWGWLAVIFLFLAVDEDSSLHELLIAPMQAIVPASGPLLFAWVVPYGIAALVIGVLYLKFVLSLPPRSRKLIIAGGTLYLSGAFVFELIGGAYMSRYDQLDFVYMMLVACEEILELSGLVVFAYALLDLLRTRLGKEPIQILIE